MGRRRFLRLSNAFLAIAPLSSCLVADTDAIERVYFSVPAGKAVKTLKLAVKQAKVEIMISADTVKGVRTREIKGNFTPLEAFDQMLMGTQLTVVRHLSSNVYTIKKSDKPEKPLRRQDLERDGNASKWSER